MEEWKIGSILLAYDGSEGSKRAADFAASLAKKYDACVYVVSAFKHQSRIREPGQKQTIEIEETRELAKTAVEALQEQGVTAERDILEGPPAQAILNAADARDVNLIVLGSRGHNPAADMTIGSTSEHVARHAKVPVLITR
jgi:nucleotide-binding universal stress UspA family protein